MYKLLLAWRYLRTRYIALASVISVTLGVATLIVVNSVMAGFSEEMHKRLHGILSDIVLESPGLDGIYDPQWHMDEIRKVVGDDLAAMSPIVRVPAMLHFQFRGRSVTQQVMLIGIDEATYAGVSDFAQYLLHPENRRQLSFQLRDGGYDPRLPQAGWEYRRSRVAFERAYQEEMQRLQDPFPRGHTPAAREKSADHDVVQFAPLPAEPPQLGGGRGEQATGAAAGQAEPALDPFLAGDPDRIRQLANAAIDELHEQYTGVILGIAIASTRFHNPQTGEVEELFLRLPGDDVQITLPSAGVPPQPISATFTIVDFYESKMSEYDASFAFVPLRKLQELRGMIDPVTGQSSVTSIQIRLRPGADLNAVRDRLRQRFPPEQFPYRVQTWRDMQGPLLAAVQLETTILNILLFLIIAVAGFGILATFFMIVVEKTRDIGILKALGAPSSGVASIFLSYGLSLGFVGAGIGIVLGMAIVVHINDIADLLERLTGHEVFDPTVYYFDQIPTITSPWMVVWVAVGAVLIAVLASVLPALRAARLHPVEALRYE